MKAQRLFLLPALAFLFACGNQVTALTEPPPTLVIVKSSAMLTPLSSSMPTGTAIPALTATADQPTPTLHPNQEAIATQRTVLEQHCDGRYDSRVLISKSGKLMAFACWPKDEKDISVVKVVALDGSRTPVVASYRKDYLGIDYSQLIPQDIQDGFRFSSERYALYPIHWTADDKFVYFDKYSAGDGDQYTRVSALMSLNIESGKLTPVLPPSGAYYYDFSIDGTKLLSVDQSIRPMIVKVSNLVSGEEIKIHLDERFDQAGYLTLSPDQSRVVVSVIDHEAGISLIVADLVSGSQKYLATDLHYDFFPISWLDDRTIYGWSAESGSWSYIYIDILTKQTRPAPTPTPIPTP